MTPAELALVVYMTVLTIVQCVGFVMALRSMDKIHGLINSRMTELLNSVGNERFAAGVASKTVDYGRK
jgi:hypothetical protein